MTAPKLIAERTRGTPAAAVLVLHGGRVVSHKRVRAWNGAALRMRPFARHVAAHAAHTDHLAVFRLRYRVRGWNREAAAPLADVRWALDEIEQRCGRIPVVLVGHSMGGRAALRTAEDERVVGIVALAPWLPEGEPMPDLTGRTVVIIHGTEDRTTSPKLSALYAAQADEIEYVRMPGGDHTMLRGAKTWHRLTTEAVQRILTPDQASRSGPGLRRPEPRGR